MSELPHDEVERDSGLTAIYRAAAQDAPPAALDDAIRAAARREAGARPRPAGFTFAHAWRVPLSVAAVIVLSVSLVTLMGEEAPDLTDSPRPESPIADKERKSLASADSGAPTSPRGFVPDEQRSNGIGLKPPQSLTPGQGIRPPDARIRSAPPSKDMTADRFMADTAAPTDLAKRRDAPAQDIGQSGGKSAPAAPQRQAETLKAPIDGLAPPHAPAAAVSSVAEKKAPARPEADSIGRAERESRVQAVREPAPVLDKATRETPVAAGVDARPAAQAKTAPQAAGVMSKLESDAELPPEKWLERIEELRRQGKVEEAKTSLAEFRKRFPNYRLPDALRNWVKP